MSWNDERVETLKRLWAEGLSASHIATELGGITRNAVIGKVHRLGISGRAKSPAAATPRLRKARFHQQMIRVARPVARGNTALATAFDYEIEAEPEVVDNVVLMGQRGSLLELTEHSCRWPIGDPGDANFSSAVDRRPAACPIVRTTAASPINPPMCGATASHSFSDQLRATATGLRLAKNKSAVRGHSPVQGGAKQLH